MKQLFFYLAICTMIFCGPVHAAQDACNDVIKLFNDATNSSQLSQKEQVFKKALELDCANAGIKARVHNNLADTCEQLGKQDEAVAQYKKALELDPGLAMACFSLGDIYFKKGNYEYAIENYERGIETQDDEIAKANLKKAREKLPLYKSKNQLVSSLSLTRAVGVSRSSNLYFGFNETKLSPESERQLESLLRALSSSDLRSYQFRLSGHTCSMGSDKENQGLSEKRADTVRDWLAAHGFPAHCLKTAGFGKAQPIASNDNEDGRQLNRRVEIKTTGIDFSAKRAIIAGEGMQLFNKGQELAGQGKAADAVAQYEKALAVFKKTEDVEGVRAATGTLAVVCGDLGDEKKAALYAKQYQEVSK